MHIIFPEEIHLWVRKVRFCGWYPNYRQPQLFRRGKMNYEVNDLVHEDYNIDGSCRIFKERYHTNSIFEYF